MIFFSMLYRNIKWRVHNWLTIIFTIVQPILWLILYSTVASSTMKSTLSINYTSFILPGLMFLVCFASSCSCGIMNYIMKQEGSFYRLLIAPVSRDTMILAQVVEAILCSFLEVILITFISLFLGVKISFTITSFMMIVLVLFLSSFLIASLGYSLSLKLPNDMVYQTMMNAIVLPIFFLSSALFPVDKIKGILGVIVQWNPFTHSIDLVRSILLHQEIVLQDIFFTMGMLIILCCLSFLWARNSLKKEMEV